MKKKLITGSTLIFNENGGGITKDKEYKVNYYYDGWYGFDGDNGRNAVHINNTKIDWERSGI